MTFREAEKEILKSQDEEVVYCLKEMLYKSTKFIKGYKIEIREIAEEYYNKIQEKRAFKVPIIEMTMKEIKKTKALLSIGVPLTEVSKRIGYSRYVINRCLKG